MTSADDIEATFREGKTAVIVGMENGYQIGVDLDNLDRFFDQGVRILTTSGASRVSPVTALRVE